MAVYADAREASYLGRVFVARAPVTSALGDTRQMHVVGCRRANSVEERPLPRVFFQSRTQ